MGTDIGGSATPIGASANVVGMSVIAKEGHIVGWGKYCKSAVPATIIVMVVATVGIWLRYVNGKECDSMELKKQLIFHWT